MIVNSVKVEVEVNSKCDKEVERFEENMRILRRETEAQIHWNRIGLANNSTQFLIRVTGSGERVQAAILEVFKLTRNNSTNSA